MEKDMIQNEEEDKLANRIKLIMEEERLTPTNFARLIQENNPSKISHIFTGRNKPSLFLISKILKAFPDISSEWLILGIGSMKREINKSQGVLNFETTTFPIQKTINNEDSKKENQISKNEVFESKQESTQTNIKVEKTLDKIIVYYSDNSFEEFVSNKH